MRARAKLLLFGASGAIGRSVAAHAAGQDWEVVGVSRSAARTSDGVARWIAYDPVSDDGEALGIDEFEAVCWAQGANMADSIGALDVDRHLELYRANCLSVMRSMDALVRRRQLRRGGARLVVVSSLWQERARTDKLSYTVTKAAVGGLVRSAAVDLGRAGHLVNAVLPGVLDTPMTAANLSPEQIGAVRDKTTLGRLPDLDTLAATIMFLCSDANKAITGQSVAVDLGMNNANLL